jgi:spermidine/putrescine-binding protein
MSEHDPRLIGLISEARERRYSRRDVVRRGLALGFALPAITAAWRAEHALGQEGPVQVPILNREMTKDEIAAEIANEGQVNVGNWTYTANQQLVERFQQYVKDTYGVDVKLNYAASQTPSIYLTELYTAVAAGDQSPYDVMAIEENYWAEVQAESKKQNTKLMEDFLPSGLIPNAERVLDILKHVPTALGFQASGTPGINYLKDRVDFLTDWKDLADERLKGKLLMWLPGDITGGGFLLGLAASLGKDYKNPDEMKEVIAFAVEKIHPNAFKYTDQFGEALQLFAGGVAEVVVFWDSLAKLNFLDGQEAAAFLIAASGQYLVNGYMWIPVNPKHPVLAQVFADWRLSDDAQFPDIEAWGITKGSWAELHEGLMGPSYEPLIPDWIKDDYFTFYPTIEQLTTDFKPVDWDYYAAHSAEWFDEWRAGIGL